MTVVGVLPLTSHRCTSHQRLETFYLTKQHVQRAAVLIDVVCEDADCSTACGTTLHSMVKP